MKNGDKDLINSIPLKSLKSSGFNLSLIPAANLPESFVIFNHCYIFDENYKIQNFKVQDYTRTRLKSSNLSSLLNNQDTLKRIVGGLRPSDMSSISDLSKIDSAISILTAASSGKSLSSVQVILINLILLN